MHKQLRTTYVMGLNQQSSKWAKSANSHSFLPFCFLQHDVLTAVRDVAEPSVPLFSLQPSSPEPWGTCLRTDLSLLLHSTTVWCLYSDTLGGRLFHIVGFLFVSRGQLLVPFGRGKLICHMSRKTSHSYVWIHRLVYHNNCRDWAISNKVCSARMVLLVASD